MGENLQIRKSKFSDLKVFLKRIGFTFENRPYQVFLARYPGIVVNLYQNGKIVLAGNDKFIKSEIEAFIESIGGFNPSKDDSRFFRKFKGMTRIGSDEVGKGDYFGPLVIAGVLIDKYSEKDLQIIKVRDSKKLNDRSISEMSKKIRIKLGNNRYEILSITPRKYNELYKKLKNLNKILGWAHSRVIENLLTKEECNLAVVDKFGDPKFVNSALMEKGVTIKLIQQPRAEQDIAVAAASILAREVFLEKHLEMGTAYGLEFPKGSSQVMEFLNDFVNKHGFNNLKNVAKIHFKITDQFKKKSGYK